MWWFSRADGEAVEHDLGRAVGHVVAVAVGDEQELRRAHQPDAAEAELDAREHLDVVGEDGALVEPAVAVGVLEDQDAVAEAEVELRGQLGVGVVLRDPEPPARVPGHGDRVLHVRLGGEDLDVEPRRHAEPAAACSGGRARVGEVSVSGGPAAGVLVSVRSERGEQENDQAKKLCLVHGAPNE